VVFRICYFFVDTVFIFMQNEIRKKGIPGDIYEKKQEL